jgi:glycosyltransferase involved in cell wall biosynthesis
VRLAVYTDYAYHRVDDEVYAERAFALFLAALARRLERMVVIGRLSPEPTKARYSLGEVEFVPLPFYRTLADPVRAMAAMARSLGKLWRSLGEVDGMLLIGPHLLAVPIALMCLLRRRRLILCVRQEYVQYVRNRHPKRRLWHLLAGVLEGIFRLLARACPVIVVGPRLAEVYASAPRLLEIRVSLVNANEIVPPEEALDRPRGASNRTMLSVGRVDAEKDPLLLAEILADAGEGWMLIVCGEGSLEGALRERLDRLGLSDRAEFRGYVAHEQLAALYQSADALIHVSKTEGVPQVLLEAFAAGLPIVASDVGGIAGATDGAALLFPAGDAAAAARHLRAIASDPGLRERLIRQGNEVVRSHTLDGESAKVAAFVESYGAASS